MTLSGDRGSFEDPRHDPRFDPVRDKERLDLFREVDAVLTKKKDALASPVSRAGITCTACRAITHVNCRSGKGDYPIEEPVHYPFACSKSPVLQGLNNQAAAAARCTRCRPTDSATRLPTGLRNPSSFRS